MSKKGFQKGAVPHNKISEPDLPSGWKRDPTTRTITTPQGTFKSLLAATQHHEQVRQEATEKRKDAKRLTGIEIEDGFFIGRLTQFEEFLEAINEQRKCATSGCDGKILPVEQHTKGLGGAVDLMFRCSDCKSKLEFHSSSRIGDTWRLQVPTLLLLSSLLGGFYFAGYERQMSMLIGDNTVSPQTWQTFLRWVQPMVKQLLDSQIAAAHEEMKKMDPETLGSFQRAVTTSDGAWHHRGFHSGNASYVVINYFNKALLKYGHVSMRAKNAEDRWQGTAKGAEGHLAEECFSALKKAGMKVEVNFQDGDSSSQQAVDSVEQDITYGCRNHFVRAHGHVLDSLKNKKSTDNHDKCDCFGKKHKQTCGCINDEFIRTAKMNLSIILKECKEPEHFKEEMTNLGKYHAQNIHKWSGGQCSFHHQRVCNCGKCDKEQEPTCAGLPYATKTPLKCKFHANLYEQECIQKGDEGYHLVHSELGSGHSNLPENFWSMVIRYRSKAIDLHKDAYETTTNLGLLHANQSFITKLKGNPYSFKLELLQLCGIDPPPAVREALMKEAAEREKVSQKQATESERKKKKQRKVARSAANEKKKAFMKTKKRNDGYGDESSGDEADSEEEGNEDEQADNAGDDVPEGGKLTELSTKTLLCFFDLESTGLYSDREDCTQLAAKMVTLQNGKFVRTSSAFNSFVKTQRKMSPEAQRITGIKPYRDMSSPLRGAPEFPDCVKSWLDWVNEEAQKTRSKAVVLVGHNVRTFDLRLLINQGKRLGVNVPQEMASRSLVYFVDSLSVLRKSKDLTWPHALTKTPGGANSLSLTSVYQAVHGKGIVNAHRADGDVDALVDVMTSDLVSKPFLTGGHLQSLPGLVQDMKTKRKKALQVARGEIVPAVRRSTKRKAFEEPANDSAQPKRCVCVCGYQRHPANSSSSKNATKKNK